MVACSWLPNVQICSASRKTKVQNFGVGNYTWESLLFWVNTEEFSVESINDDPLLFEVARSWKDKNFCYSFQQVQLARDNRIEAFVSCHT
jgi:hypothetical protein